VSDLDSEDIGAICWALVQDAGHLDCGGWSVGEDWKLLCACGTVLFELADVAK
jgi:hypothetical protein